MGVTGGAARDAPDIDSTLVPVVIDGTMISKHRCKAMAIIITLRSNELIPHIVEEENPLAVWNIL